MSTRQKRTTLQKIFLGLGILFAIIFSLFILGAILGGLGIIHGQEDNQTEIPYFNCVYYYDESSVTVSMNDKCNEDQWNEAREYYKANCCPIEHSYYQLFGKKTMILYSPEFNEIMNNLDKRLGIK